MFFELKKSVIIKRVSPQKCKLVHFLESLFSKNEKKNDRVVVFELILEALLIYHGFMYTLYN